MDVGSILICPAYSGSTDHWEIQGNTLIRHHRQLRVKRSSPLTVRGMPINIQDLVSYRKTVVMDNHGRIVETHVDEWAHGTDTFRGQAWKGQTRFYLKVGPGSVHRALTEEEIRALG